MSSSSSSIVTTKHHLQKMLERNADQYHHIISNRFNPQDRSTGLQLLREEKERIDRAIQIVDLLVQVQTSGEP